jgi:hypothetical protein
MKRKGRISSRIKDHYAPSAPAPTGIWKWADWLCGHEVGFVLVGGLVFAVITLISHALGAVGNLAVFLKLFSTFVILGVFACVIVVTEENPKYATSGPRVRIMCGAIACAGIAAIFAPQVTAIVIGAIVGAILGYFGRYWVDAL